MMNNSFEDPIVLLDKIFRSRQMKETGYSLRMFANDLGVSVSILSDMFNGKRGMSKRRAESVAQRLGLVDEERTYFCAAANYFHGRSFQTRQEAKEQLMSIVARGNREPKFSPGLSKDFGWQGRGILELLKVRTNISSSEIARSLKISKRECQDVLNNLVAAKLLNENADSFSLSVDQAPMPEDKASEALLKRARQALFGQDSESHMNSLILAFNSADLGRAKEKLSKFMKEFNAEFGGQSPDDVYCLGLEFFRLSEKPNPEGSNIANFNYVN